MRKGFPTDRNVQGRRRTLALVAAVVLLACARVSALPASLFGTWDGGNDAVSTVRFSDGGRIELNDGACAGSYSLSAMDGGTGAVDTGYIQCPGVMDGYIFGATVTVEGDSLTISGPVINGRYSRR